MDNKKPSFLLSVLNAIRCVFVACVILLCAGFIVLSLQPSRNGVDGAETTKIINDLRNLKSAAALFQTDIGRWPVPGEEASVDLYCDRQIVGAEQRRYENVTLSGEIRDAGGAIHQYVGVELMPTSNGTKGVQTKLAWNTQKQHVKIFQEIPSNGVPPAPYQSGLNVYMEIR